MPRNPSATDQIFLSFCLLCPIGLPSVVDSIKVNNLFVLDVDVCLPVGSGLSLLLGDDGGEPDGFGVLSEQKQNAKIFFECESFLGQNRSPRASFMSFCAPKSLKQEIEDFPVS